MNSMLRTSLLLVQLGWPRVLNEEVIKFISSWKENFDLKLIDSFQGGLDASDGDGDFAYMWEDDVMQVKTIFGNHFLQFCPNNLMKELVWIMNMFSSIF